MRWVCAHGWTRRTGLLVALVLGLSVSRRAAAGGWEFPELGTAAVGRGGAIVVGVEDLTAMQHNPAGLLRQRGTRFLYNHNLVWENVRFVRWPSQIPQTAPVPAGFDPETPVHNTEPLFPLGVTLALGSDFGLENWSFGIGLFGPSAVGRVVFPINGSQRYLFTESDILAVYYTATAAYGRRKHWGVGLSLQYVHVPHARLSLVVDASTPGSPLQPYFSRYDVLATIDAKDNFSMTAIAGAWWRPHPRWELAIATRFIPAKLGLTGRPKLEPLDNPGNALAGDPDSVVLHDASLRFDLSFPVFVKGGVRYIHPGPGGEPLFDVEADVTWENWSVVDRYDVKLSGTASVAGTERPLPDIVVPKAWRDTLSVRTGGTVHVLPGRLSVSAGGFWERGATPPGYEHFDFISFDRWGLGGGIQGHVFGVDVLLSYMHIFQERRSVDELHAKVFQQRPLAQCPDACGGYDGVPANAGTIDSSLDILSFGLQFHFDEW